MRFRSSMTPGREHLLRGLILQSGPTAADASAVSGLPQYMRQSVKWHGVVPGLVIAAIFIYFQATGQGGRAWALVAGAITLSVVATIALAGTSRRAATAAHAPVVTHRIQESIRLNHPPEKVWALIAPAENAALLTPNTARAYRVPGTPAGVGEQQAFTNLDGHTSIVEVTEYIEARLAVTKVISPPLPVPVRATYRLEPSGAGCLLHLGQEYDAAAHHVRSTPEAEFWRAYAVEYLARVRRTLATWDE